MKLSRRHFMQLAGAGTLSLGFGKMAFAAVSGAVAPRLVVVSLRGGMDALHVVPPFGDPDYVDIRSRGNFSLALRREVESANGTNGSLPLRGTNDFRINNGLRFLQEEFNMGRANIIHAVAPSLLSPSLDDQRRYTRSHFDAQDLLDLGGAGWRVQDNLHIRTADFPRHGWIHCLLQAAGGGAAIGLQSGLSVALRGPDNDSVKISNWSSDSYGAIDRDLAERLSALYDRTNFLAPLKGALEDQVLAGEGGKLSPEAATVKFMTRENGPNVGLIELTGWDHHNNIMAQPSLTQLDQVLKTLVEGFSDAGMYSNTLIVVMSEFGRTAYPNGAKGTDHGTGGVAFILGGSVQGGKVFADNWPGLRRGANMLYLERDLKPTNDLKAFLRQPLQEMFRLTDQKIDAVLPGAIRTPPVRIIG